MTCEEEIKDKSEFVIFLPQVDPEYGDFIHIQEGSGDSLTADDIEGGFIDYIDYTRFSLDLNDCNIIKKDGGQCLIKIPYSLLLAEDIVQEVLDMEKIDSDYVICPCIEMMKEKFKETKDKM
jgi:hypothetical protein